MFRFSFVNFNLTLKILRRNRNVFAQIKAKQVIKTVIYSFPSSLFALINVNMKIK